MVVSGEHGLAAQPVVQVLASFPANFLFPLFTALLLATGVSLNIGGIVLMALGSQWYILFNVVAGASAIPNDLREAAANLQLPRKLWWRKLILPAIFPSYVTGGITAAGGAWNASIVAEIVTYNGTTLTATGLGAYIKDATSEGNSAHTLIGVIVMSFYVVAMNRFFWLQQTSTPLRHHSALLRLARIGLLLTIAKIGLVCDEGRIRRATQLLWSMFTSNAISCSVPSAKSS